MGTITITPLVDGAFVSTSDLNADFRKLSEINGNLDVANVALIDRLLDYTYIQLGAVSGGMMVGGTANLDYFNNVRYVFDRGEGVNLFMGLEGTQGNLDYVSGDRVLNDAIPATTRTIGRQKKLSEFPGVVDAAEASASLTKAIPGAATTFYLPFRAHVLVTWQVAWTSDAARLGDTPMTSGPEPQSEIPDTAKFPQPNVAIRFFFDGREHAQYSTTRESREAMFAHMIDNFVNIDGEREDRFLDYASNGLPVHKLRDRHKARYWSGHAYIGTKAKGFHTTSLRVISQEVVRQTRVRVRNIKVLYFKA